MADLCDLATAVPVRRSGFMDWSREKGRRMFWQFWFADGSSMGTYDTKKGFMLTERMMKAGVILPGLQDGMKAAITRAKVQA